MHTFGGYNTITYLKERELFTRKIWKLQAMFLIFKLFTNQLQLIYLR